MTLQVRFCPFCLVHALVYDGDDALLTGHLKRAHGYTAA